MKHWLPLSILLLIVGIVFYFHLYDYLTFANLKMHRQLLLAWTEQHFLLTVLGVATVYIIAVACSVPGATFLTLLCGFLFGPAIGTGIAVISATLGAFLVFMAVELALRDWVAKKTAIWLKKMEAGFQNNAFSYLLFLRFVPLFPFWLVNIVPALLGIPKRTFLITTFFGILPGTFVYVMVGNGLGHIFDLDQTPNLKIIFDPRILLPLLGLAILSLVPVLYKLKQGRNHASKN